MNGVDKFEEWMTGREVEPHPYDNLPAVAAHARWAASRALDYAQRCDALLARLVAEQAKE